MNIQELLQSPEGKTLEFKRDLSSPDGIVKSLIAFANTAGGILILGVEDKTKHVCGVSEPLVQEERLANIISDTIEPRVLPDIQIHPWRHTHLVVVQIFPSATRPHYIKQQGLTKSTYVRVGSTNRLADAALIEEMKRHVLHQFFDEQPLPELNTEAIDFLVTSELFKPIRTLTEADLQTLQLVTTYQNHVVPTIGGMLLFGKERQRYFPDAWLQAGRFAGETKAIIRDSCAITSYPLQAIKEAMDFIGKHSLIALEIQGLQHVERWNIPQGAIREALINAFIHTDYSQQGAPIRIAIFDDRIEIENPGLLPFGLTLDDIQRGTSKLRNRVIARVFQRLGLIESWGSGIQRINQLCQDAGLKAPIFEELGHRFRVTLYNQVSHQPILDSRETQIMGVLKQANGLTTQEVAHQIQLSTRATRTWLARLVEKGIVLSLGTSAKDPKRRYYVKSQ
jgi:ATP-dependent DNA helicase RecG